MAEKKERVDPAENMCTCGHSETFHKDGSGACSQCFSCGGFTSKAKFEEEQTR